MYVGHRKSFTAVGTIHNFDCLIAKIEKYFLKETFDLYGGLTMKEWIEQCIF